VLRLAIKRRAGDGKVAQARFTSYGDGAHRANPKSGWG
jgi:hypothetical protein